MLSTASKNFIGIVEGEQRTADQSTSNLRLNEIGVPWLFHPCSLSLSFSSICQPALLTSPTTRSPAYTQKRGRIPKSPPGFFKSKKKLLPTSAGKSSNVIQDFLINYLGCSAVKKAD